MRTGVEISIGNMLLMALSVFLGAVLVFYTWNLVLSTIVFVGVRINFLQAMLLYVTLRVICRPQTAES